MFDVQSMSSSIGELVVETSCSKEIYARNRGSSWKTKNGKASLKFVSCVCIDCVVFLSCYGEFCYIKYLASRIEFKAVKIERLVHR